MSVAEQLTRQYFDASNQSDMVKIASLLHDNCSYYSARLGFFIGQFDVIKMQTEFHQQYQSLHWEIVSMDEIKPNVIDIHFDFKGVLQDGTEQHRQGREHILVYDDKIQHIAVE